MTGQMDAWPWIIGIISPILTAIAGWFAGRRKNTAEASLLEVEGISAIRTFYEDALNNMKEQLQYYIKLTESNRAEIETNRKEVNELRKLVTTLVSSSCTKTDCKIRQIHNASAFFKHHKNNEVIKNNLEKTKSKDS